VSSRICEVKGEDPLTYPLRNQVESLYETNTPAVNYLVPIRNEGEQRRQSLHRWLAISRALCCAFGS
jgi:hypothetical protein